MDSYTEIKRWSKPKRNFEFGYELSSTTQISPRNPSSASCISVLTCDDSIHFINEPKISNNITSTMKEYQVDKHIVNLNGSIVEPLLTSQQDDIKNIKATKIEDRCDNPGVSTEKTIKFQEELTNKGSLYSRITTGYIGSKSQGVLGTQSEIQDIDESGNGNNIYDKNGKFDYYNAEGKLEEVNIIVEDDDEKDNNTTLNGTACSNTIQTKEIQDCVSVSEPRPKNSSLFVSNNESNQTDQWREVHDNRTGKIYFYNRRTRESRWSLPPNAILLSEKRRINLKEETTLSNNLREVSINTESTKSEETSQERCTHLINHMGYCEIDETIFDQNEFKETTSCTDGYKRPWTPSQNEPKRKLFFLADSELQDNAIQVKPNETYCPVEANDDIQHNELQKTSIKKYEKQKLIFCILCGMKAQSTTHLIEHMSTYCSCLSQCAKRDDICNIFYDTFVIADSLLNPNDAHDNFDQNHYQHNKENDQYNVENRDSDMEELRYVAENDDNKFSASDDEDTIMDYSLNQSLNQSFRRISSHHSKEPAQEETSELVSTCPFCSKSFQGGSYLSKHLLRCNARQNSSMKRTIHCN